MGASFFNPALSFARFAFIPATCLVVGAFFGEIGQHFKAANDVRMDAINGWVASSNGAESQALASRFITECLISDSIKHNDMAFYQGRKLMKGEPISLYGCGEKMQASALVAAIKRADNVLTSYAWPLSLVDPRK